MTQTFVYFDDCFKGHVQSLDYPECSDRVQNIIELINKEEFKNIIIKQPKANRCHKTSSPAIDNPELKTPTINAPNNDPIIVPRPPKREVPPITTAVIESKLPS